MVILKLPLLTYLIAIIDDASRMIVGAEFFFNDNAVNFHKVWKSAVLRYGKSKVMILDNGSSYKNGNTKDIAARLGTQLVYCRPYTPTGKAKLKDSSDRAEWHGWMQMTAKPMKASMSLMKDFVNGWPFRDTKRRIASPYG